MSSSTIPETPAPRSLSWRVVDIVVAAVLSVAVGLIFFGWNTVGYAWYESLQAVTPGLAGLAAGVWLLGGPLGGLIIRKPGAALLVETLAASVSAMLGSQWGWSTIWSGLAQGIAAELVFALFLYKRWGLGPALLSGAAAGVGAWVLELFTTPNLPKGLTFNSIYLVCLMISGAVLAGLLAWLLVKALAKTGALNRFAAGRDQRELV